ncbi:hypothetical protein FACS1894145_6020 [Bacteroidia bacterium]|nr:hypothetical protein FACS1894145_6020 [Bacteroidia bacterium]
MAIKESSDSIIILEDSIVSLKELVFVKNLQGKYLYIDLWATWCIPCKQEFQYKGDLDQVLTQYPNIVPVYISMDNDELDQLWRKNINQYVLFGYHLRASKTLQNDILKQVYKGSQSFEIPRYILLNDSGTIVNDDLPRPRASDQLKEVLDGLM